MIVWKNLQDDICLKLEELLLPHFTMVDAYRVDTGLRLRVIDGAMHDLSASKRAGLVMACLGDCPEEVWREIDRMYLFWTLDEDLMRNQEFALMF
jgi:hypothetical protein